MSVVMRDSRRVRMGAKRPVVRGRWVSRGWVPIFQLPVTSTCGCAHTTHTRPHGARGALRERCARGAGGSCERTARYIARCTAAASAPRRPFFAVRAAPGPEPCGCALTPELSSELLKKHERDDTARKKQNHGYRTSNKNNGSLQRNSALASLPLASTLHPHTTVHTYTYRLQKSTIYEYDAQ